MLFRFREAQAAELGLSGRTDRRPRVASSCTDLRQCERWRGEILRDISRKVSKIQDGELIKFLFRLRDAGAASVEGLLYGGIELTNDSVDVLSWIDRLRNP